MLPNVLMAIFLHGLHVLTLSWYNCVLLYTLSFCLLLTFSLQYSKLISLYGCCYSSQVSYGILYRDGPTNLKIWCKSGDRLDILVENMGRVGYSDGILRNTKVCIYCHVYHTKYTCMSFYCEPTRLNHHKGK